MKVGLTLMNNVPKSLIKNVLVPLGLIAAASQLSQGFTKHFRTWNNNIKRKNERHYEAL